MASEEAQKQLLIGFKLLEEFWKLFGGMRKFASRFEPFIEDIRTPRFTVGAMSKIERSITYRQINSWESLGFISPARIQEKRGWRKFSYPEAVLLLIISQMRSVGLDSDTIKKIVTYISWPVPSRPKKKALTFLEAHMMANLLGVRMGLMVWSKAPMLAPAQVLFQFLIGAQGRSWPLLYLPLADYIVRVTDALGGRQLEMPDIVLPLTLTEELGLIRNLVEDGQVEQIKITKSDGKVSTVKAVRRQSGGTAVPLEEMQKALDGGAFAKFEVTAKHGQVVTVVREDTYKL